MKVEVGKSYRFKSSTVVAEEHDGFGGNRALYASQFQVCDPHDGFRWCGHRDTGVVWGAEVQLEEIDEPTNQQAVVTAETKRPRVGYWEDEPGELERMRRVFATWDFRTGA